MKATVFKTNSYHDISKIEKYTTIHRDVEIKNLFPCGEGAGYAGGIVSAAIDGERCADGISEFISKKKHV